MWLNDGAGSFSAVDQTLSTNDGYSLALGDVDGDLDLDAVVGVAGGGADEVWLNDGAGNSRTPARAWAAATSLALALGDVDGDLDLDLWMGNWPAPTRCGSTMGPAPSPIPGRLCPRPGPAAWRWADLDGDLDLDAFTVHNGNGASRVWLNDGAGSFSDTGQTLGGGDSYGVALGDLDLDGDIDAYVANYSGQGDTVWPERRGARELLGQRCHVRVGEQPPRRPRRHEHGLHPRRVRHRRRHRDRCGSATSSP